MKTFTADQVRNHAGFSVGDEIHLNDINGTIVKVKDVSFVMKFGRVDVYVDYEWRTERRPMYQCQKGVSLENFRDIVLNNC